MSFVETIVVEFLAEHLYERLNSQHWLIERLKDHPLTAEDHPMPDYEPILDRLILIDREFQIFVETKYQDRFTELTEPLITRLKNGSKQKYYDAFKSIADELFSTGVSWTRIVTFLVYSAELINKVIELPNQKDKEKTFKMVSQIISCVCRYFDENLLQWINEQDGGWENIIEYTKGLNHNYGMNADNGSGRGLKQYIGVAAFAVVIGGLYLCAKLTVQ